MRTYLLLAAAEFRRYSTYRLAILAGVTTQSVFGFIRVSVLFRAISSAGGTLAGYNQQLASTYVWLGQALLEPIALLGWIEIAERVSSGEIAVDFARPIDLQLAWWARDLGRASFQLLSRGLPPLFIGAVAQVPPCVARLVCAGVRGLGLAAGMAGLASRYPQVHRDRLGLAHLLDTPVR